MKKILLTFLILLSSIANYAQTEKASMDSASRKTADAICNCLVQNKAGSIKTQAEVEQVFMKCMLESAKTEFGEVFNAEDPTKFGEELGKKLGMDLLNSGCDEFIKMSLNIAAEENATEEAEEVKSLKGAVTSVEERDFIYLTIKSETNRELRFIYMHYVPGSDEWIKNSAKLKGKKVNVSWVESEVYQPKIKEFVTIKQLKKLEVL